MALLGSVARDRDGRIVLRGTEIVDTVDLSTIETHGGGSARPMIAELQ